MATIEELLQHHREEDDKRFDALTAVLTKIDDNVESLLLSRAYARGAWWSIASLSTVVSAVVGLFVAWWKH